jgi:hypothetical protein
MNKKTKLKEAEYFLARMKAEQENQEDFKYNLSAFLSAARSVLQYAERESNPGKNPKAKPGAKVWYGNLIANSPVLKFFKCKRNVNIHIEPVKPQADYLHEAFVTIEFSGSSEDEVRDKSGKVIAQGSSEKPKLEPEKQKKEKVLTKDEVRYTFSDWPGDEDVFTLCECYIQEIKKGIQDGVSKGFITE